MERIESESSSSEWSLYIESPLYSLEPQLLSAPDWSGYVTKFLIFIYSMIWKKYFSKSKIFTKTSLGKLLSKKKYDNKTRLNRINNEKSVKIDVIIQFKTFRWCSRVKGELPKVITWNWCYSKHLSTSVLQLYETIAMSLKIENSYRKIIVKTFNEN